MVIEWLKVRVSPELRDKYIQTDAEIWTTALAKYSGYLGKEVWLNPEKPDEVVLIIRWATREQWKAIPQAEIDAIEKRFDQAMGNTDYEMVEFSEYQIRKFPQPSVQG